jgi:hypothetical protein
MIIATYCYNKYELSNEKDDCHLDDVLKKDEVGEPINQTIGLSVPKFEMLIGQLI